MKILFIIIGLWTALSLLFSLLFGAIAKGGTLMEEEINHGYKCYCIDCLLESNRY